MIMKIFKRLIPKEKAQEVTHHEVFTLRWEIQANGYNSHKTFYKAFIKEEDCLEYEKQLKSSADFLGTWVKTKVEKG